MDTSAAERISRRISFGVFMIATLVAVVSARPEAGSWNDGSRLATVESLVDFQTWAIDQSIFVDPSRARANGGPPYPEEKRDLLARGTQDKLLIGGQFYSDKSPVPAVFMAGIYKVLQLSTGLVAREQAHRFCFLLTLLTSGIAYVVAVCCIDRLGVALAIGTRLLLTCSFAFATVALPYTRQVNNHILLLAICCVLALLLTPRTRAQLLLAGTLTGAGYTIDLGLGPVLVITFAVLVACRTRSLNAVAFFSLGALPWFAFHHYLNHQIGGTFAPANANLAYLAWPGSPFDISNTTGRWAHGSVRHFIGYALDLLFGKRGFFGHNLALFLAAPGAFLLLQKRVTQRPEIIWAAAFSLGSWLIYAITSNNYSGVSCSIRWFVPLLAPAYYVLAILLRDEPRCRRDLLILTLFGVVMGGLMWWKGPWMQHMVPGFWFIQIGLLVTWLAYRHSPRKA